MRLSLVLYLMMLAHVLLMCSPTIVKADSTEDSVEAKEVSRISNVLLCSHWPTPSIVILTHKPFLHVCVCVCLGRMARKRVEIGCEGSWLVNTTRKRWNKGLRTP